MAKQIRVLFVVGSMGGGGDERQVIGILKHLDRSRFTPHLYLVYREGELLDEIPDDVIVHSFWDRRKFPRLNYPGRIHRWQVNDLAETIRRQCVDVVCDHHYHMTMIAGPATEQTGVKRVSVVVNDPKLDLENQNERFVKWKRRLLKRAYRSASRVAAVSEGVRAALLEYFDLQADHVVTVHNFVDIERIDKLASASAPEFDPSRFHVVSLGRLHYQKGYSFLLEAIDQLVNQRGHKELLVHILGQGLLEEELKQMVRERRLDEHVNFAGFVPNPFPLMRHAHLFCMSSLYEGMPNALIEAMACRVPVLSTDCPSGPRELLSEGEYGRLVTPADAHALADVLEDAMVNYDQWKSKTDAARSWVEQQFSFSTGISKVEELFELACFERPVSMAFALPFGIQIGGTTTWTVETLRRLHDRQCSTVLLSHASKEKTLDLRVPTELTVVECERSGENIIDHENVEHYKSVLPAVFVPSFTAGTYGTCAKLSRTHATQMRVVGYCHTYLDYYFNLLVHYEPIIHRFVAVSEECGTKLCELIPHRSTDIIVKPYGIQTTEQLQREYTSVDQPIQLLYAGRIQQRDKRVFDLLTLADELACGEVDFFLRIVGEGIDKQLLVEKYNELDDAVRSRVSIEDSVAPERMPDLLRSHDVCVMVSEAEGTSVFMLEAMVCGCVPVVTDVSGTGAVVQTGENGFRHDIGDLTGIATSIDQLSNDRALVAKLGQAAHASSRKYDVDDYVEWFEKLADEVWQEEGRAWPFNRRLLPSKSIRSRIGDALPWGRQIWRRLRGSRN